MSMTLRAIEETDRRRAKQVEYNIANNITPATIVLVALLLISGSQFTLFAMWFDMESNKDLGGRGRRSTDR